MKPKAHNRTQFDFRMDTRCTIGTKSLDQICSIMKSAGIHQPLWILPSESSHRKIVRKLLGSIYGKTEFQTLGTQELGAYLENKDDEDPQRTHTFDCLIACGNSESIDRAKAYASLLNGPGIAQDPPSRHVVQPPRIRVIAVPFGLLDGLECQGRIRYGFQDAALPPTVPTHVLFDGRLSKLTTDKAIARTMCTTLQEVCTTLLTSNDPMVYSVAMAAFAHAHLALELLLASGKDNDKWREGTLAAGAALHAAGVCAENRGPSVVISFSETLAVEGFADYHQTAAAMLPVLLRHIHDSSAQAYDDIQSILVGMDPIEFANVWISLSDPKGTDRIIGRLCGDTHALLSNPDHASELEPLLALCNGKGEASE